MRWIIAAVLAVALVAQGLFFYLIFFRPPANAPTEFLRRGRSPSTKKLVVCFGDSLTHATLSGDYVAMLRERFGVQGYEFVNAGFNGDTTHALLKRLDKVIACQPDFVTILIGTNDVNATRDGRAKVQYFLPYEPTLERYRANYEIIIKRLQAETNARIALLSIPPLGEDLFSEMNRRVVEYCGAIHDIALAHDVTYLPLYESLTALINTHQPCTTFKPDMRMIIGAGVKYQLLGKRLDDISGDYGYQLLTDSIHLNERGAAVVAKLIGEFIS